MEKLEKTQYKARFAIKQTWKGTSRSKLYEDLGLDSLSYRRFCWRIILLHIRLLAKNPQHMSENVINCQ